MKTLLTCALLGAAAAATAAPPKWMWRVDHLQPWSSSISGVPGVSSIAGRFTADDLDGNGELSQAEVSSFQLGTDPVDPSHHFSIVPWTYYSDGSCTAEEGCHSSLDRFSFNLATRTLDFAFFAGFGPHEAMSMSTGEGVVVSSWGGATGGSWGPGTTITVSPVPEPAAWLLLALGLAGLAPIRRSGKACF